ncbi:MAG: uracil-DNA glycosylase [Planctomycetota bacterium]
MSSEQPSIDPADTARAEALLRQDALTLAAMGVDFLPINGGGALSLEASKEPGTPPKAASIPRAPAGGSKAARLDALRERYEADAPHAPFITEFTKIVFGDGDPDARIMFVGEAPGADEDKAGIPFVGRAGQLLNKMIGAMGLSRETVYIANVLKVRPPNNATPTPDEIEASRPYLLEQIDTVEPEVLVALGLPAAKCLLGVNDSMARLRARFHAFETPAGRSIPVMPTYHPAYLLRAYTAENRGKVWSDLQQVMERIGLPTGS